MKKKYVYKPYSDIFSYLYEKEKQRILSYISYPLLIEHIGSTAVPNLGGKGIIDIAIAVDQSFMDDVFKQLQTLGYEHKPFFNTQNRFYFVTYIIDIEEEMRRYHIHLIDRNHSEWLTLIKFRDFLRTHLEEKQEYDELKKQAVNFSDNDGEKYRKFKEHFFKKFTQ